MLIFNSWYTAGKANIYAAANNGSGLRCLTSRYKLQSYQRLQLSLDRSRLLFWAQPPGEKTGQFFFGELETGRLLVDKQEPRPVFMHWLTGDQLLCSGKEKHWLTELSNSNTVPLDWAEGYYVQDVAADADRLLLRKGFGIGSNIYVGYIARGEVQEVFHLGDALTDDFILSPLSWSPDGRLIACLGGYEHEYWLINADGSNPHKVADSDYFWHEFQWSPDGGKFAYTRSLDGGGPSSKLGGIFVKSLPDGEEKLVFTVKRGETCRWVSDSQSIIHVNKCEGGISLLQTDVETGASSELISLGQGIKDITELIVA